MDLKVGAHCAHQPCHQLDFLPVKCAGCGLSFCGDHARPESHGCAHADALADGVKVQTCPVCSAMLNVDVARGEDPNRKVDEHISSGCVAHVKRKKQATVKFRCSVHGCTQSEFQRIVCSKCGLDFCLKHRFEDQHQCRGPVGRKGTSKSAAGKGKEKNGSRSSDMKNAKNARARKKKMLRTKTILKQPPVGANKIEEQFRVSFPVYFPSDSTVEPMHICFHRDWTIGKAIDVVASHGRIRNNNNVPGAEPIQLFSLKTREPLATSEKIHSLIPVYISREGLVLERGQELQDDYIRKKDTEAGCTVS